MHQFCPSATWHPWLLMTRTRIHNLSFGFSLYGNARSCEGNSNDLFEGNSRNGYFREQIVGICPQNRGICERKNPKLRLLDFFRIWRWTKNESCEPSLSVWFFAYPTGYVENHALRSVKKSFVFRLISCFERSLVHDEGKVETKTEERSYAQSINLAGQSAR